VIWKNGYGKKKKMKKNEVIRNSEIEILGGKIGYKKNVNKNENVKKSKS
jgi:fumarate hydratase class II